LGKNSTQVNGYRLVYVEWEDSYGCASEWENLENCSPEVMICQSVGWLIHDDKKCKVIVPHLNMPDHPNIDRPGCGDMTIPTSAILRIADLKAPKARKG
jgi:hypothetical protein